MCTTRLTNTRFSIILVSNQIFEPADSTIIFESTTGRNSYQEQVEGLAR